MEAAGVPKALPPKPFSSGSFDMYQTQSWEQRDGDAMSRAHTT